MPRLVAVESLPYSTALPVRNKYDLNVRRPNNQDINLTS